MSTHANVIQITTHDSGRHFGCFGHPTLNTPALDQLAAEGIRFGNYFCTAPICSPSRATQLTGLYPQTHGMLDLPCFGWRMRPEVRHASHRFKDSGYQTVLFGLQHEVPKSDLPALAFDEVRPVQENAEILAAEVAAFLRQPESRQQPFYAQVGFVETHTPFSRGQNLPDQEKGLEIPPYLADTPMAREAMAGFQGAVKRVDRAVQTILEALHDSGLEENTLLVFTTDHGLEMPRAKWHLYDAGIEIAMIMRFPAAGLAGGRVCPMLLSNVDYLPTVLGLLGLTVPEGLDGIDFSDAVASGRPSLGREAVFSLYHKTHTRSIRTGTHKLIRHFDNASDFHRVPVRYEDCLNKRVIPEVELFDLVADPNEFENLSDRPELAEVQRRLDDQLWRWLQDVVDPVLQGPVRSPSYELAIRDYDQWRRQTTAP